jgi:VWFA-related protein
MKLHVAYRLRVVLSLLSVAMLFVSISAQTTRRNTGKRSTNNVSGRAANTSRDGTLIICQGLPVPKGYAIIAYLTSTACPHGAYVLKKQDPYSESVAARYAKRHPSTNATQSRDSDVANSNSSGTSQTSLSTATPTATSGARTNSMDASVTAPVPNVTSSQPVASTPQPNSTASTRSSDAGSRPRRVAVSASRNDVALVEDPPERPARPPQWAGTPPTTSPSAASAVTVIDPGPEEVSEGDVVRVDTSLVTVPVSVLDRQGRFIPDLQREDFRVFENGVEQAVAYWEPADKPFTVALLLDTSPSTQFHLWQIKEAAIAFAKQLRPQDRVLIVSFNDQVLLLTEVTNDMNVVSAVIEQNANMGNATRLYDAVHLVIKERLNQIKGRKAIVLFTDGVDTASFQANYASTIREVEELDALIYPIQYDTTDYLRAMQSVGQESTTVVTTTRSGPFGIGTTTSRVTYSGPKVTGPNGGPLPGATQADYDQANQYLKELADRTAGRLYRANDPTQLAEAFSRIAEELRRQYSLGYYPQHGASDGEGGAAGMSSAARREIKVRVNRPNLAVKARDSYVFTTPPGGRQ